MENKLFYDTIIDYAEPDYTKLINQLRDLEVRGDRLARDYQTPRPLVLMSLKDRINTLIYMLTFQS